MKRARCNETEPPLYNPRRMTHNVHGQNEMLGSMAQVYTLR